MFADFKKAFKRPEAIMPITKEEMKLFMGEEPLLPNGKRNGEAVRSMLDKIRSQEQKDKESETK